MDKEFWNALSDEEKTNAINEFLRQTGWKDFDYKKAREDYERLKKEIPEDKFWYYYCQLENPCMAFSLIDPVLSHAMYGLLYSTYKYQTESGEKQDTVPVLGFRADELYFNKGTLMEFSDSERQILEEATRIIQSKIRK